jgi:hypothetical protein
MSSFSRFLPGLMVATVVGVASGYYTFQPMIVEEAAAQYQAVYTTEQVTDSDRQHGGIGNAEVQANAQGKEMLNTAIRETATNHARQDERIEKVAAITTKDKV